MTISYAGSTGATGPEGPQGVQGIQGTAGASVTILGSYADLTAFDAGAGANPGTNVGDSWILLSDGSLMVWNGSSWFDAGDIKGPQGIQGIQGLKGDTGSQGIPGTNGTNGAKGDTGNTGAKGDKGDTGSINLYYGHFHDTTTQTNGGATSDNVISIASTESSNGVTIGAPGSLQFANSGSYFVNFLGQFVPTGGGTSYAVTGWMSLNGTPIPNSASIFTASGINGQVMLNLEGIIDITAGDVVTFHWWSNNTYMRLVSTAAGTNPTRPATPSVVLTVFNVGA